MLERCKAMKKERLSRMEMPDSCLDSLVRTHDEPLCGIQVGLRSVSPLMHQIHEGTFAAHQNSFPHAREPVIFSPSGPKFHRLFFLKDCRERNFPCRIAKAAL